MRPHFGTILILALLVLSACGLLMACMDSFTHYGILTGGVFLPTLTAWLSAAVLVLFTNIAVAIRPFSLPRTGIRLRSRMPDLALWRPLQLAFADGILNPKSF